MVVASGNVIQDASHSCTLFDTPQSGALQGEPRQSPEKTFETIRLFICPELLQHCFSWSVIVTFMPVNLYWTLTELNRFSLTDILQYTYDLLYVYISLIAYCDTKPTERAVSNVTKYKYFYVKFHTFCAACLLRTPSRQLRYPLIHSPRSPVTSHSTTDATTPSCHTHVLGASQHDDNSSLKFWRRNSIDYIKRFWLTRR